MSVPRPIAPLREKLRSLFFGTLRKGFDTDDGREIAVDALQGLLAWRPFLPIVANERPYPDLGPRPASRDYSGTVFITARFRTGSTLLWNIFRHVTNCVSYYEPLSERRLFDPAVRGDRVDPTHRGISDYWREYEDMLELGQWHRADWTTRSLVLNGLDWCPDLRAYFDRLIERAAPRRAVIQENRIDFRLAWIRRQFPGATILHLYRHPRDQWCSSLMTASSVRREVTMAGFGPYDHFYLKAWARDLERHFPFLSERREQCPYRIFYLIWRLSYIFGVAFADHSLAYEDLVSSPEATIRRAGLAAGFDVDAAALAPLVTGGAVGRWHQFAEPEWYEAHETACEAILTEFFCGLPVGEKRRPSMPPSAPVASRAIDPVTTGRS